ncbi:TetR/AcrR family transcriptional regulator [Pontibacter sp. MBLB2868]|uniref:TetR/AcrR family transcriptional regulator n=1 Tax=Pontibacter sp. MBLB2868 TaxID=3451555 RepID=UPI003F74F814
METIKDPKSKIITKAKSLFFAHGYTKVLMAHIARELGMSKKTLYQYFNGKEELLNVVIEQYQIELQRGVETIMADDTLLFSEKVTQIFSYVATKLHAINPLLIDDIKENSPKSWVLIQEYKADAAFLRFNALLDEGVEKGFIRDDVNRPLAVLLYASALETILNPDFTRHMPRKLTDNMPTTPDAVFDGLVNIIFNGILNGETNLV